MLNNCKCNEEHVVRIHRQSSDIPLAGHLRQVGLPVTRCAVPFCLTTYLRPTSCISSSRRIRPSDECLMPVPHYQEKLRGGFSVQIRSLPGGLGKACFRYPFSQSSDNSSWAVRSLLLIRSGPLQIATSNAPGPAMGTVL